MSVDLARLSKEHEGAPPEVTLKAASELFPRFALATSFGVEDVVLIDIAARHGVRIEFFTLDTGLLFAETYELWKKLETKYGVTVKAVNPARTVSEQAAAEGPRLWLRDANRCCDLRKVQPLKAQLATLDAWATGIRRDQTPDRANSQPFEDDRKFGLVKVNPLVTWTAKDVWRHIHKFEVPYNPLHDRGYPSIGCTPCTSPVAEGEDPRSGRWRGQAKTECGLHADTVPLKVGA